MNHLIIIFLAVFVVQGCNRTSSSGELFETDFRKLDSADWVIESETEISWDQLQGDGFMDIDVPGGITIWYNEKLKRDVIVEFEVTVVDEGGQNDRVSDLNCFWMASDPENPNAFFERGDWRNGVFWRYYSLELYYVGLGGHDNTKTRFRKYHGSADPVPEVIDEYTDSENLITPNQRSKVRIECIDGITRYFYNNRKLFELKEESPLKEEGYFGFRTVNNHMKVHSFSVYKPE